MVRTLGTRLARRAAVACAAACATAGVLAAPASANFFAGEGTAAGVVNFTAGSIPDALQVGCNSVAWNFDSNQFPVPATAGGFLSLGGNAFAGLMAIQASGTNGCEFIQQGNGPLSVNYVFGTNVTGLGTFSCGTMGGRYTRVGQIVLLGVSGPCYVTGAPQGTVIANTVGVLQPTPSGGNGVTSNITQAYFGAGWNAINPNP